LLLPTLAIGSAATSYTASSYALLANDSAIVGDFIEGVTEIVGVFVGVIVGVNDMVGVMLGVKDMVGVMLGVGVGVAHCISMFTPTKNCSLVMLSYNGVVLVELR
jgi:hypothetical protein